MFDEEESLIVSTKTEYDEVENVLRPKSMEGYVGQEKAKTNLSVFMQSAKLRGEPLDHVLLYGPPGLGKTTLAHIIAAEMGVQIKVTSGPSIEKSGDLAAILTNLNEGDVLYIEKLDVNEGDKVTFDKVLAVSGNEGFVVGAPYVGGATVVANVVKNGKSKKIDVIKYKAKKNEKKKIGHRQPYTKVQITKIDA